MTTAHLKLGDEALILDLTGALFLPQHETLVVSDLHFEKGSSFIRQGLTLPPYDTRTTLRNLQQVCTSLRSAIVFPTKAPASGWTLMMPLPSEN